MKFTTPLKPYKRLSRNAELNVEMTVNSTVLQLRYVLKNVEPELVWPEVAYSERKDNLWATTCFELFVGSSDSSPYFEINLSPSGDWNLYRFDDYRKGMNSSVPAQVTIRSEKGKWLEAEIGSTAIMEMLSHPCKVGATAVLDWGSNQIEYWAMLHSGPQADFHRRDDWLWTISNIEGR